MRLKGSLLTLLLVSMFVAIPTVVQSGATYGPRMDYLHIINYGDPSLEFAALELGEIDITDWPLDAYWTNKWVTEGKVPGEITLDPYSEIGSFEYDINVQRWPTGGDGVSAREGYPTTFTTGLSNNYNHSHTRQRPDKNMSMHPPTYDPATQAAPMGDGADYDPETDSWKTYFDEDCLWDVMAWGMRLAIAFLTDKDYVVSTILEGLGTKMITSATVAMYGYLDVANLTGSSFVYPGPHGDVTIPSLVFDYGLTRAEMDAKAVELLEAAGFKDWDGDGTRNDPRKVAGADKEYGTGDDDTSSASNMDPLIFYIRLDDPDREAAGLKLKDDLIANGIPVDFKDVEKTVCFKAVMVDYNYHLYTGGYSFGADPPDLLYGLFHSSQYWYPVGWSGGYQGFAHTKADEYIEDVKYSGDLNEIIAGVRNATYLLNKYVSWIPLWSSASSMAYRTGWEGVVNHAGYGISWGTGGVYYWSLFNMRKAAEDTINLGFKSNPEDLNVITSEWVWDYIVLDATYESLIVRNPYNLAEKRGMLAASWSTGTWDGDKVYVDYTLKSGVKFHNGKTLTAEDVKWGIEFMRDCGPGVAWGYATLKTIHNVTVLVGGEGGTVRFYMTTGTYYAVHDTGFIEIINPEIWQAADLALGWGYNEVTHTFTDVMKVRDYHPYVDDYYPGGTGDGIPDLSQDGTGPWVFLSPGPAPYLKTYIDLVAFRPGIPETTWQTNQHHLSQASVENWLNDKFHEIGNVNYPGSVHEADYNTAGIGIDRSIDVVPDLMLIERASAMTTADPAGIGWDEWNVDADINSDNIVDALDYGTANLNLLKRAG